MDRIVSENVDLYTPGIQDISDSITQNWTEQALECYYINCNCAQCSIGKGNYSFICQMPKVIEILLQTAGEPEKKRKSA